MHSQYFCGFEQGYVGWAICSTGRASLIQRATLKTDATNQGWQRYETTPCCKQVTRLLSLRLRDTAQTNCGFVISFRVDALRMRGARKSGKAQSRIDLFNEFQRIRISSGLILQATELARQYTSTCGSKRRIAPLGPYARAIRKRRRRANGFPGIQASVIRRRSRLPLRRLARLTISVQFDVPRTRRAGCAGIGQ
jgi:hypothetical protein